ncbi:hypothetical protein ABC337_12725 [Arthrobacter sp. 1P04PC]|uniref:hypothetical protein n=1 Tax=unclassified Arthrobacter TaxID=235627 RepID=UPI0039A2901F
MSAALERLKQHDAQQAPPAEQTDKIMEVLTSLLTAVETQNSRLAALADRQEKLASYVRTMDLETNKQIEALEQLVRLSITPASEPAPNESLTSETVRNEMNEFGQTLSLLAGAIDGKQIAGAVSSLMFAKNQIEKTTAWNSDKANEFVQKYQQTLNVAGRAISATKDKAVTTIEETASAAADGAAHRVDAAIGRLDAASQSAERLVAVAERLQKPLGWAAVARLSLVLLPVAAVLLMGVMTVWTLVVGIRWALAQDWEIWLNITAGIGLTGFVAGVGFGLWRLTVWVKVALDRAAMELGRRR